ncbi:DNA-binding protein [Pseudofrankia sp. BMG5.37]|uniref:helix-turn-helix transcriptional regulator n=1 Tax=Pseudofrankia sp. BMG5.37 TaxID=3050035 RepID=UPI0028947303|nr:DNA-binding protein [Pseudofrankia sp. BMG5.37]MDT3446196.1 DNA-binding protein [Pseudofrankia sp. BMG5.37]
MSFAVAVTVAGAVTSTRNLRAMNARGPAHQARHEPTGKSAKPTAARKTTARNDQRVLLTLDQVLAELGGPHGPLPRSTWSDWQLKGKGPKVIKLPNGQIRVTRDDLNDWLDSLTRDPAAR